MFNWREDRLVNRHALNLAEGVLLLIVVVLIVEVPIRLEILEELSELSSLLLESLDVVLALSYPFTRVDYSVLDVLCHFQFVLEKTRLDLELRVAAYVAESLLCVSDELLLEKLDFHTELHPLPEDVICIVLGCVILQNGVMLLLLPNNVYCRFDSIKLSHSL